MVVKKIEPTLLFLPENNFCRAIRQSSEESVFIIRPFSSAFMIKMRLSVSA
jgi:hypothetical protein